MKNMDLIPEERSDEEFLDHEVDVSELDYQVKVDELAKEAAFLMQYSKK